MAKLEEEKLIYDWNTIKQEGLKDVKEVEFDDETLRDGIQSPSVKDPDIEEKIEILHLMDRIGINGADVGLPGAGPRAVDDVTRLCREIVDSKLKILPNCAARTVAADITPVIEISQKVGIPIEVAAFIGSSPIRQYAEDWDLDRMLRSTEEAVKMSVEAGLPVMYVTEDTTRADPETLKKLYLCAIENGARRICVCDTVGHATPDGTGNLIRFVAEEIVGPSGEDVTIDWHGHKDRGLSLINSLVAAAGGAGRIHGTALGIGERVGNAPMDLILVNMRLLGWIDNDLSMLPQYVEKVSEACDVPLPQSYPVFGEDAFRTGTGVHAAAVIKAKRKGDNWLADRVYSGVPAGMFGREQKIEIGPMSGESNVVYWLESHGFGAAEPLVKKIFDKAKTSNRLLSDEEVMKIAKGGS